MFMMAVDVSHVTTATKYGREGEFCYTIMRVKPY